MAVRRCAARLCHRWGDRVVIALVTDSSSQLPAELAERYAVSVVPIPVTVDDTTYNEGVDLDADGFYAFFADGIVPEVSTSQPSPGRFVETYASLVEAGAIEILSVHVGKSMSGTLNSARLGAETVNVPVHLVDSRTTSFGVSCCVWEAAEALAAGADLEIAAQVAEAVAADVRSVFILQALDFVLKGGRAAGRGLCFADDVPVLRTDGPHIGQVGSGRDVDELCDLMAVQMHADGDPIRVALGTADAATEVFTRGLVERLAGRDDIVDLVHYRVGPSVGAHTGPGTAGGFWYRVGRR
jgi:DegV family protein with EDD domain